MCGLCVPDLNSFVEAVREMIKVHLGDLVSLHFIVLEGGEKVGQPEVQDYLVNVLHNTAPDNTQKICLQFLATSNEIVKYASYGHTRTS